MPKYLVSKRLRALGTQVSYCLSSFVTWKTQDNKDNQKCKAHEELSDLQHLRLLNIYNT